MCACCRLAFQTHMWMSCFIVLFDISQDLQKTVMWNHRNSISYRQTSRYNLGEKLWQILYRISTYTPVWTGIHRCIYPEVERPLMAIVIVALRHQWRRKMTSCVARPHRWTRLWAPLRRTSAAPAVWGPPHSPSSSAPSEPPSPSSHQGASCDQPPLTLEVLPTLGRKLSR